MSAEDPFTRTLLDDLRERRGQADDVGPPTPEEEMILGEVLAEAIDAGIIAVDRIERDPETGELRTIYRSLIYDGGRRMSPAPLSVDDLPPES